jgi:hypothetical protein
LTESVGPPATLPWTYPPFQHWNVVDFDAALGQAMVIVASIIAASRTFRIGSSPPNHLRGEAFFSFLQPNRCMSAPRPVAPVRTAGLSPFRVVLDSNRKV